MATPLTASQLVAALKAEGVVVKTPHTDWTKHERDAATGKPFGPVRGVMIHHTASHGDFEVVYSGNAALPGPRAHVYINRAGEALMCSAGRANHAGGGDPDVLNAVIAESYASRPPHPQYGEGDKGAADGNDVFYGFECENLGTGKDPWPQAQYLTMIKAATAICRHHGWGEKSAIGHLEWSNQKVDPRGFEMPDFRTAVKACLALPAGRWPATPTKPQEAAVADLNIVDVRAIWLTDGVIKNPNPATNQDNGFIAAATALNNIEIVVRRMEEKLAALQAVVQTLTAKK